MTEQLIAQLELPMIDLRVSFDLKTIVFAFQNGGKTYVSITGKLSKPYDGIGKNSIVISHDNHVAYIAIMNGKQFVVLDDSEQRKYDTVGHTVFSSDSKRLGHIAVENKKQFVVLDGKEGKPYDAVGLIAPIFSANSQHVGYSAKLGKKAMVVIDDMENGSYDNIAQGSPIFSPDSKRIAYQVKKNKFLGEEDYMVVDGVEHKHYDAIDNKTFFSPDSQQTIYAARQGKKYFLVKNEHEEKPYDGIGGLTISPNSKRFAYMAKVGNKNIIVLDGIEGKPYDEYQFAVFSPDSEYFAYRAQKGEKFLVVRDGVEGKKYDEIHGLKYSPDNNTLAYCASYKDGISFIVVNEEEGKPYDLVAGNSITFSPDSKHVAHVAKSKGEDRVVIDGKDGKSYSTILTGITATQNSFQYLAIKDTNIYLVEDKV